MSVETVTDAGGQSMTMVNHKGDRLPLFVQEAIPGLGTLAFREDNILICAYHKSGEVGGCQNWFTETQLQQIEEVYRDKMAGSSYSPRYTLH